MFQSTKFVLIGQKGNKGERGQTDDTRNQIKRIENRILTMQENISNLIGKLCKYKLDCVHYFIKNLLNKLKCFKRS